jgi:OmpA-OmpF porin, OOP family
MNIKSVMLVLLGCASLPLLAQNTPSQSPSANQMIEQLKPNTRSLRNLKVEAAAPATATPVTAQPAVSQVIAEPVPTPAAEPMPSTPPVAEVVTTPAVSVAPAAQPVAVAVAVAVPQAVTVADNPTVRPSLSLLIQFDFNSARVRPESQQALANLSVALQSPELRNSTFALEGHTDAKGSADYNVRLSALRAQAVREYLMGRGIEQGRLQASGKGASELANVEQPFAPENRRVRIVNLD